MGKSYSVTREVAAKSLNVSTRTIDRYVKSGKLSYKKIANKVLLAKEEILELKKDFTTLHQELTTEIVSQDNKNIKKITKKNDWEVNIDEKIEKFFLIFKEKEKILEEKNKMIFVLQQRVTELETKIQHMIALPDYNKEKQEAIIEKQKLEEKIGQLKHMIQNEKLKNLVFIGLSLIFIVVAGFFIIKW